MKRLHSTFIASVVGVIGIVLGVLISGVVQRSIQSRGIRHQDQQLRLSLAHDTDRLYLEAAWKAKLSTIEELHRQGRRLFIVAWEVHYSSGEGVIAKKKLWESVHEGYTDALANALLYVAERQPPIEFLQLQTQASAICLNDFDKEESKHQEKLLREHWRAFNEELQAHLPKAVLQPVNPTATVGLEVN